MRLEGRDRRVVARVHVPEADAPPRVTRRDQQLRRRRVDLHREDALRHELGDVLLGDREAAEVERGTRGLHLDAGLGLGVALGT